MMELMALAEKSCTSKRKERVSSWISATTSGNMARSMKRLLDIKPSGGTYIYSACEAFSEEAVIDFVRLWHWLDRFDIKSAEFSAEKEGGGKYNPIFDKRFHASVHASREDITWVIDQIDPDFIG
jgi:ribonuclease J